MSALPCIDEAVRLARVYADANIRALDSETAQNAALLARALLELHEENARLRASPALTVEELNSVIDAQGCMRGHCNRNDKWHVAAIAGLSKLIGRACDATNDAVASAESWRKP